MIHELLEKQFKNKSEKFLVQYKKEKKPVYLYGAGRGLVWYKRWLDDKDIKVDGIIASVANKEKGIISLDDLNNEYDKYFIISAPAYRIEIIENLVQYVDKNNIFIFDPILDVIQGTNYIERLNYYKQNILSLERLYLSLIDEKSKMTMLKVVEGSISNNCDCYSELSGESQYFPDFILDNMGNDEVFVDVGGYTGDTIEEFIEATNAQYKKIISFEPDEYNYNILTGYASDRIIVYQYGVSDKKKIVWFQNDSGNINEGSKIVSEQICDAYKIECISLDEIINEKIDYIKMDIEGEELSALKELKN